MILKSFLVLSASMPTTKASKMCRGWTTEVHWQPGDSPKWFYCKRLTDGHTSYFPRTCSGRSAEKILVVGTGPKSPPRGAGRVRVGTFWETTWALFVDGGDAGAPIHNEFLCHSSAVLGTGGVQTRRQPRSRQNQRHTGAAAPSPIAPPTINLQFG